MVHLQSLIVSAPSPLRDQLRRHSVDEQIQRCARLRIVASHSVEHQASIRGPARERTPDPDPTDEADDLEAELEVLVADNAPELLAEPGVGAITAAQVLNAWAHPRRLRSEAAFAMLSGTAPIPAWSGQVIRHRLNRGGDRQLNRVLYTIVVSRMRFHPETRAYVTRRQAEGLTPREIKRCLNRYVARRLFRILEANVAASPLQQAA